jgi:hypothetical protein
MRLPTLFVIAAAVSQMGATDCGNALSDPGFDLWCGDQMCDWKIERGSVTRVATWSEGDPGVELDGDDVAIEQLSPVDSGDGNCLEFDLIADVSLDAQVVLNIDVFGDGSVERTETIATTSWAPQAFKLPIQGTFRGIRFEIVKTGPGHAVLAQIGAKITDGPGCAFSPIVPAPAPLGAPCGDSGCASGMCELGTCVDCTDGSCPASQTCGIGEPTSPVRIAPRECVGTGSHVLGEQCVVDAECASSICVGATFYRPGNCSTCRTNADCTGDETCGPAWSDPSHAPSICGPGLQILASGAACASNADCSSGVCSGTPRLQCEDGRACSTDLNCPFENLKQTACTTVGIQGGNCE